MVRPPARAGEPAPCSVVSSANDGTSTVRKVIAPGAIVDWWCVARRDPASLVLRSIDWFPGEGWLGYQITEHELIQVGALRPKGIPGFLYWKALYPVHRRVFRALAAHRVNRAGAASLS